MDRISDLFWCCFEDITQLLLMKENANKGPCPFESPPRGGLSYFGLVESGLATI